jgi:opacity protein-like surface antigen
VAKAILKVMVVGLCLMMAATSLAAEKPAEKDDSVFDEFGVTFLFHDTVDDDEQVNSGPGLILGLAASIAESEDVNLHFRAEVGWLNFGGDTSGNEFHFSPALRLYVFKDASVEPFFDIGVGLVHNSTPIIGQGTEINFLSYGGFGFRFNLDDSFALDVGYRIRHISNAGLDDENGGLNSHMYLTTLSFKF